MKASAGDFVKLSGQIVLFVGNQRLLLFGTLVLQLIGEQWKRIDQHREHCCQANQQIFDQDP